MNQNDKQMLAALIMAGIIEQLPAPKSSDAGEVIVMALRALEDVVLSLHPNLNIQAVNEGVAFLNQKLATTKPTSLN